MIFHKRTNRVDIQVSIMTGIIVIFSCSIIFLLTYCLSYNDMITSLQDRVSSIYEYLDEVIDKETFESINVHDDANLDSYKEMQVLLQMLKEATGVMYLYTAKPLDDGSFIYVVDGLDPLSPDFRYPGDPIEPEIHAEMREALSSIVVMPNEIKNTSWGHIFISYLPIHKGDDVIGVIGIEFDAKHQYETYQLLRTGTPLIIIIFCFISALLSVLLFRRISNPHYHDFANTDLLTGLKNRNAFETDINNLNSKRKENIAILSIDLDRLKIINDTLGHLSGDEYIISSSKILHQHLKTTNILYRIGGDEFIIIMHDIRKETAEQLSNQIEDELQQRNKTLKIPVSFSLGYATFDESTDSSLFSTFKRADAFMYATKKKHRLKNTLIEELDSGFS